MDKNKIVQWLVRIATSFVFVIMVIFTIGYWPFINAFGLPWFIASYLTVPIGLFMFLLSFWSARNNLTSWLWVLLNVLIIVAFPALAFLS